MEGLVFGLVVGGFFVPDRKIYEWMQTRLFSPRQTMKNKREDKLHPDGKVFVQCLAPWGSGPWMISFIFAKSLWLWIPMKFGVCVLPSPGWVLELEKPSWILFLLENLWKNIPRTSHWGFSAVTARRYFSKQRCVMTEVSGSNSTHLTLVV